MANVFQPVTQQAGPQMGQVSAPIAQPTAAASRDRSNELLSIMDGAARMVSAFGEQRAARAGAEAEAGQDQFLADFESGFVELEEQRARLQGAEQEVSAGVFRAVRDGAAPEELAGFVEALDDIKSADEAGVLDPYRYRSMVERATANAMSQHPAMREDLVKIRDRYIGREAPAQEATNTAQMLQNEYMTSNYGSNWDEHDLYMEAQRVVKEEKLGDLQTRLELSETKGKVAATEIDFAVRESTEAAIMSLNNRFSTIYNSQGFLNEDQIIEYEDSLQQIGNDQRRAADRLVQQAGSTGVRVTDDRIDRIRDGVGSVIEGLSISNLEGRDLGTRLDNIRKLEENWLEHNVPMLPFVEMFSDIGGDQTIARLAHLERLSRNPAGIDRYEGLMDPATMELTNSVHGAFWQTAYALENREQFRDTLSGQQRRLYDFMLLDVVKDNPSPEGKDQDFSDAVDEAVADIDVSTGEVGQAMDYLTTPNVVTQMSENPTSARITLANIGRQLFDMAATSANDPEVMRDVDISNIRTSMGLKPARDIEQYIKMIDQYADMIPELGGGREFFNEMVDHTLDVQRQQQEARDARVSPRQQSFRDVGELAEAGGLSEEEQNALFMLADGRGQRSVGAQVAALEKLGVQGAPSMLREDREAALQQVMQGGIEPAQQTQEPESDSPFREQLMRHEGTVTNAEGEHEVYLDSLGNPTVGHGRLVTEDMGLEVGDTITDEQAQQMLEEDEATAEADAKQFFSDYEQLNEARQAVLKSMAFNLGRANLSGFVKTREALARGDYETAAAEMLDSTWATQVGRRATELAEQMRTGEWQ